MDSLLGYYRMFFRSKKWYHRLFFHFLDLCVNNAWLLYVRDFKALETEGKHLSLYEFKSQISYSLRNKLRPLGKVGRPLLVAKNQRLQISKKRKLPPTDVIEDQVGHFPIVLSKRGYCRNIPCKSQIVTLCMKCKVYLCIGKKQCFLKFHGVEYDLEDFPY